MGGRSRDPEDLSYWGYPARCHKNTDGNLVPLEGSLPDVVIQFSWKNTVQYEFHAFNDIMNRALEKDHAPVATTRPTLGGYLIKVRFSRKRTLQGAIKGRNTQVDDALDPNNLNAVHWRYVPGGPD